MLDFILLLVGFIAFVLAAISVAVHPRVNLVALGLAAWILVPLHHAWPG